MRIVIPVVLVIVALLHALPVAGVLGAERLAQLYGIDAQDANVTLLLRHRAVLFGLLACLLGYAAFHPALHGMALLAGLVSVVSFLMLAQPAGQFHGPIVRVVRVDWVALGLLLVGGVVFLRGR